ncbi:DNA methylase [Spirochaetia bacterium]|nr:DNA methylase [Spirochaetia bacterium]
MPPQELFSTHMVPVDAATGKLFDEQLVPANDTPVTCLGKTFASDIERRVYFTEELHKKLADPDFRKIEGFPIGKDEDLLALSDPPYYTACPNPWIADFIAEWEKEKSPQINADGKPLPYHREPFAADVSEGKNDPIYNAHSYHTKVPHKAIMRYILHYTEPGDIVFDGFCGTGMTGVAAQMCGNKEAVQSLGYTVNNDGTILQDGKPFSRLGARRAVLNDLSPFATFVAYSLNFPVSPTDFELETAQIASDVEKECAWMYQTKHTDGNMGKISYIVWSDVYICTSCTKEIVFWDVAVDRDLALVKDKFYCPYCNAFLKKAATEKARITYAEPSFGIIHKTVKQVPVLIYYIVDNCRFEKKPDEFDISLINKISSMKIPYKIPLDEIIPGDKTNDPLSFGIRNIYQYYTHRNLYVISSFWSRCSNKYKAIITSLLENHASKRNRYILDRNHTMGTTGGPFTGTLYLPPLQCEVNIINIFRKTAKKYYAAYSELTGIKHNIVSTNSLTYSQFDNDSLDYIFLDPPFGSNYMYSELNYSWESWLGVKTSILFEAIENKSQSKTLLEYRQLMRSALRNAYWALKPGRWITIEFSNTKAAVWNCLQLALADAGFIIATVNVLDKKHGGLKSMTYTTAVKQDLVISAYKPNGGFEERFVNEAKTLEGVWDFVRTHLKYLPVVKVSGDALQPIHERDPRILFDQMVAYYVRKNYLVPLSSQEFQAGLPQRFAERDGMYFLPDQVAEYDSKKLAMGNRIKNAELFVLDEATAIQWLRQTLQDKRQTFQQIHPHFIPKISDWSKNEKSLELSVLLEQNFLKDDKDYWYVPDVNKASDLEKLREKALLKEFAAYTGSTKKLKIFRMEAVRSGFKKAWQEKDYDTIINVAERLPGAVLDEDAKLLMWYDQAQTRRERV